METTKQSPTSLDAISLIIEAGAEASSPQEYYRKCLAAIAESMHGPFALLEVQQGATLIRIDHDGGSSDPDFWREPLGELIEECISLGSTATKLFAGTQTGVGIGLFATPLNRGAGALALILPCPDGHSAARLGDRLESLAAVVTLTATGIQSARPATGEAAKAKQDDAQAQLAAQALRRASDFENSVQLAITVTNRLSGKEGFEQVSMGRVQGKRVKLLAVSGLDHIEKKSEGIEYLEQAMAECLDFAEPVACQVEDWSEPEGSEPIGAPATGRLHQGWHEAARLVPVVSIPLNHGNEIAAIISIRRSPGAPLTQKEIAEISKMVAPFGGALAVVDRANQSLGSHLMRSLLRAPLRFFSKHAIGKKIAGLAFAAFAAWSWFGTMPYRVSAPSELIPGITRVVGVPVDAPLKSAGVAPGDRVTKGDILAVFDTEALELESKRLESELAIVLIEENQAIANSDPVAVSLKRARGEELTANLNLILHRIDLATIRAPFSGVLVEGDLRERIGDNFSKGETLFRIVDTETFRLELWIDEADIDVLQTTQLGSFSAFARPEVDFPFTVTRIAPAAESHGDQNAFLVEATLETDADWTRSGMEGVGSIEIEQKRPLWIWFHGVLDTMRMNSWL